jgi:hypothetical protein
MCDDMQPIHSARLTITFGVNTMAYKMKLKTPYKGMPFIWNLSGDIGDEESNKNFKTDVELFQRLVIANYKLKPTKRPVSSSIGQLTGNGIMDGTTATYVYHVSLDSRTVGDARQINPAKNGTLSYGGPHLWTIGYVNHRLFNLDRAVWENFPQTCSPTLKQELLQFNPTEL